MKTIILLLFPLIVFGGVDRAERRANKRCNKAEKRIQKSIIACPKLAVSEIDTITVFDTIVEAQQSDTIFEQLIDTIVQNCDSIKANPKTKKRYVSKTKSTCAEFYGEHKIVGSNYILNLVADTNGIKVSSIYFDTDTIIKVTDQSVKRAKEITAKRYYLIPKWSLWLLLVGIAIGFAVYAYLKGLLPF